MNYSTKLLHRERMADDVMVLRVEKPENFDFLAGQFCFMTVPDIGFQDERGLRRHFSIASSPLERDLLFVTKLSGSSLKRTLSEMVPGSTVTLEKPLGSFTLPQETSTPLVFFAGGIGITPFRSMVRYVADAPTNHRITLFYSGRVPEETPFLAELKQMMEQHREVAIVITMTRAGEDRKRWDGLTGRISPQMIQESCKDCPGALYYTAGPPNMADGMRQLLEEMGIPSARIKVERFAGYS